MMETMIGGDGEILWFNSVQQQFCKSNKELLCFWSDK